MNDAEAKTGVANEPGTRELGAPPGPDPREPNEERVPPSEPADDWALERARRELELLRERIAQLDDKGRTDAEQERRLREDLQAAREALDASERRRQIDQELFEAHASDLETARLLTEIAVSRMEKADVASAVRELRRRKPHLFRRGPLRVVGGSSAAPEAPRELDDEGSRLTTYAADARVSGDRMALLRYLRAKRGD